ncbi:MAG: hypothetical protein IKY98_00675 [Alphaproteobacteria bacterium]|nr:hypothetical protein [Alphaproteobacteria bacterium]
MTFEIFLDILIIALLSVGITYAIILEHRLSGIKENRRELAGLIEQFYKASQKTAEEFMRLKKMEDEARSALKADMERAGFIRDELTFMINKIQESNAPSRHYDSERIEQKAFSQETPYRSSAEQDLIDALNALK